LVLRPLYLLWRKFFSNPEAKVNIRVPMALLFILEVRNGGIRKSSL